MFDSKEQLGEQFTVDVLDEVITRESSVVVEGAVIGLRSGNVDWWRTGIQPGYS